MNCSEFLIEMWKRINEGVTGKIKKKLRFDLLENCLNFFADETTSMGQFIRSCEGLGEENASS